MPIDFRGRQRLEAGYYNQASKQKRSDDFPVYYTHDVLLAFADAACCLLKEANTGPKIDQHHSFVGA